MLGIPRGTEGYTVQHGGGMQTVDLCERDYTVTRSYSLGPSVIHMVLL
jgi:hypothetical protein